MKPTLRLENKLFKKGFKYIAGLDEAGKGSWAGPLVAAAVILPSKTKIKGVKDSKLLTPKKRHDLFLMIIKRALAWSVGIVSQKEIDQIGIIPANRLAFEKAISKLSPAPQYLLIDGVKIFQTDLPYEFIINGDQKIFSIACASIIAKVVRDYIMGKYDEELPEYGFRNHKGYGTDLHSKMLEKYGLSEIHRRSFKPMIFLK